MAVTPGFFISRQAAFTFPLDAVSGVKLAAVQPSRTGRYRPEPLFQRTDQYIDDANTPRQTRLRMRLNVNKNYQGIALQMAQDLEDAIGTADFTLWYSDDMARTVTTSDSEISGLQIVGYDESTASWIASGDLLYYPDSALGKNEVCLVSGTGASAFSSTLTFAHGLSGESVFKVDMIWPKTVLASVRQNPVIIGKGSFDLEFLSVGLPIPGDALPT